MKIIFMGTPAFAVKSLEACLELGEVVAVVTQPDKPRGRGQEVSFSPVKELAVVKGLPVLQPRVRRLDGRAAICLTGVERTRIGSDSSVIARIGTGDWSAAAQHDHQARCESHVTETREP